MDRSLLTGAILLLIIELFVFFADLGLLPFEVWRASSDSSVQESVGEIVYLKDQVRRRSYDSILWESSEPDDDLYANDSVLTLSNSAAKLKLKGDVKIDLHENTLVVLEPQSESVEDRFRLRFYRGDMRSRNSQHRLRVGSGDWTLQVQQGSDLSLRSLEDGQLEMEVSKGEVALENKKTQQRKKVANGVKLTLDKESIQSELKVSESLQWQLQLNHRIYSHQFPTTQSVEWEGAAKQLHLILPDKSRQKVELKDNQQRYSMAFEPGTYYFSLHKDSEVSPTLSFHVLPAPKIYHFSPLPRDRVKSTEPTDFFWTSLGKNFSYRWELIHPLKTEPVKSQTSNVNSLSYPTDETGAFYWHVIAIDELGFEAPPLLRYPIYSLKDPLAAPRLRPIKPKDLRSPAQEKPEKPDDQSSLLQKIWNWMIPQARAQEELRRSIIFTWYPVPEADIYTIEISKSPDFRELTKTETVRKTEFRWTDFNKKVYYFRVAAGKEDGRMGLFSEPQRVDLRHLGSESKELQPGILYSIETPTPTEKLKPKSEPPKPPAPKPEKQAKPKQQAEPVEKETVTKSEPTPRPVQPKKVFEKRFQAAIFSLPSYRLITFSADEDVRSTFQGAVPVQIQARVRFPIKPGSLEVTATFQQIEWQASEDLVIQEDLSETRLDAQVLYRALHSNFSYGLGFSQLSYTERKSSEEVQLIGVNIALIPAQWHWEPWERWEFVGAGALGYGDEVGLVRASSSLVYKLHFSSSSQFHLEIGGDFGFQLFFSDAFNGHEIYPQLRLGAEW